MIPGVSVLVPFRVRIGCTWIQEPSSVGYPPGRRQLAVGHSPALSVNLMPHDRIVCVNSCLTRVGLMCSTRTAQGRNRAGILSAVTVPLLRLAMTHPGTLTLPEERQRRLEGNISRSGYHVGGTGFASSVMQCATEGRGDLSYDLSMSEPGHEGRAKREKGCSHGI